MKKSELKVGEDYAYKERGGRYWTGAIRRVRLESTDYGVTLRTVPALALVPELVRFNNVPVVIDEVTIDIAVCVESVPHAQVCAKFVLSSVFVAVPEVSTAANAAMNKTERLLDRSTGNPQIVDSHCKLIMSRDDFFKVAKVTEVVDCVRDPNQSA